MAMVMVTVVSTMAFAGRPASAQVPAPAGVCARTYAVVSGDFWGRIATRHAVTIDALFAANGATAKTVLHPGNQVCLPEAAPVAAPTAPVPAAPAALPVQLAAFPAQGSCWFGDSWMAPRGAGRVHEGVDVMAKAGAYIYAVQDGKLSKQTFDRPNSRSGNAWWLTGADGTYYFYAHMSAFAPDLKVGSKVVAGQIIGYVGRTGNAAGAHLHFEIHPKGGAAINPTAIVKAVDGCKRTEPYPQPGGAVPSTPSTVAPAPQSSITPAATTTPAAGPATAAAPLPAASPMPAANLVASPANGLLWQFFSPKAAFDSSWNGRALSGGARQAIRVDNLAGVPSGTSGVIVRLTAKSAGAAGYLTTYPCDNGAPAVSMLNFPPGGTAVGTSVVEVVGGTICVTVSALARVKVEVVAARSAKGVGVQAVSAVRALDTRDTGGRLGGSVQAAITPAALGVNAATQALTVSVTIVNPVSAGTLSIGFCGQGGWAVPFNADPVSSFAMTMRVNSAGWCVTSTAATDVIVDVVGNWGGGNAPAPVDPARLFDSRSTGSPVHLSPVSVPVSGGATTVVLSITTVSGATGSSVFAVPCGEGRSAGTVIATSPARVTTAVVPVRVGNGAVCISALQPVDVIVDVVAVA